MTKERKQLLENVGFVWEPYKDAWDKQFLELLVFKNHHGHCRVPLNYPPNPKLAIWAKRQRREYKLYCERRTTTTKS